MTRVAAVLSMLHERADANSATRTFRAAPVLQWTIDRLCRAKGVANIGVLCWEDQLPAVEPIAESEHVDILVKGPRRPIAELDRVTASRKWADGWRGGLHGTCAFDAGFYAPWVAELADKFEADAVLILPPSSAMVDPDFVDALIARAAECASALTFAPAAPGFAGAVLRRAMLDQLIAERSHPGRTLHYMPERPMLDPISSTACVTVPATVARTSESFLLDSERRIGRFTSAAVELNGHLIGTGSEELVRRMASEPAVAPLPREVVLELNTSRSTSPVYWPGKTLKIDRPDLDLRTADRLFTDLRAADDVRLTIGGVGDPLRSPALFDVIAAARSAGVDAIHVETDLAEADASFAAQLAVADIDVVSVFLPALAPVTYAAVMGIDALTRVLENLKTFVTERVARGRGVPIVVPTFVKLAANLAEMDAWYDQWLTAVGAAAIVGPSSCGGQLPSLEVADITPARRGVCSRLASRMTVLSDGRVVSCEQDVTGRQVLGRVGEQSVEEIWSKRFGAFRNDHATGAWTKHAVCVGCKDWHRAA